jgi:hypothetical protein
MEQMVKKKLNLLLIEHPTAELSDELVLNIEERVLADKVALIRQADKSELTSPHLSFEKLGDETPFSALSDFPDPIRVILWGFSEDEVLPFSWVRQLAARQVMGIDRFVELPGVTEGAEIQYEIARHRPMEGRQSDNLVVFPGPIVPTNMGSHQRAFGLLEALSRACQPADVMLTCGNKTAAWQAEVLLSQICPQVHINGPSGRRLPATMRARRLLESQLRKAMGDNLDAPRLFEERLHTAAAFSGRVKLRRLLEYNAYSSVIVSYVWMEPIRALLPDPMRKRVRWICDTHDVQFVRGHSNNVGEFRLGVSDDRERFAELEVLANFDHLLAISPSDADEFRRTLPDASVLEVPAGFDYAIQPPKEIDVGQPVFGFIGGGMDANVKATEVLLEKWWPAIVERWPRARLRIAGKISLVPAVANAAFLKPGIELLGYVSTLKSFYESIDTLLNPLVVQGGLNFKSVESLMAGRLLATTKQGDKCLGEKGFAIAVDDEKALVTALAEEFNAAEGWIERRISVRERASARFADESAYAPLLKLLAGQHLKPRADSEAELTTTRRVLIQVGDHFENWRRTIGLMRVIAKRGHHPIALIYGEDGINFLLSHGVDVCCLSQYTEPSAFRHMRAAYFKRRPQDVPRFYKYYDLDDLTRRQSTSGRQNAIGHIHRMADVLRDTKPDVLLVWNGYTGITANILRQTAAIRGLDVAYLERSLLPDSVFVDRRGVNGYSGLNLLSMELIRGHKHENSSPAALRASILHVPLIDVNSLRSAGPWRKSKRIIFVPLQVESDTNIILHSPIKSMAALLHRIWNDYHDKETAIVVRPHPEEQAKIKLPRLPGVFVDDRGGLDVWLELADLTVTINSTVGLSALLRGRPVLSYGKSIFSGKGLTDGNLTSPKDVDAYAGYLIEKHTSGDDSLPLDVQRYFPKVQRASWAAVHRVASEDVRWVENWQAFCAAVGARAESSGLLELVTDLLPEDSLQLTYTKLKQPITLNWLRMRAREVFNLTENVKIEVSRYSKAELPAKSTESRIVISRDRNPKGMILDKFLAPWVPVSLPMPSQHASKIVRGLRNQTSGILGY